MFAQYPISNTHRTNMLNAFSTEALFQLAEPESALPNQQYRFRAIEVLFSRDDEKSEAMQDQLLSIYLENLYNETFIEPNTLNTLIKTLEGRITRHKATVSQKLIYALMQAKIKNLTQILSMVSEINLKLTDISNPAYEATSIFRDMMALFGSTFSKDMKRTFISRIEKDLRKESGSKKVEGALHAVSYLEKTKSKFITKTLMKMVFQAYDYYPFYGFYEASNSMLQACPDFLTHEDINGFVEKLSCDGSPDRNNDEFVLTITKSFFQLRPDLIQNSKIDILFDKLNDEDGDVAVSALEAIGDAFKARPQPDWVTSERIDAVAKKIFSRRWHMQDSAHVTLQTMLKIRPDLITKEKIGAVLGVMIANHLVNWGAHQPADALQAIFQVRLDFAETALQDCDKTLNDENADLRWLSLKTLEIVFCAQPSLVTNARLADIESKLVDKHSNVQKAAINALRAIFKVRPELVDCTKMDRIFQIVSSSTDSNVEYAALKALQTIVQAKPDLVKNADMTIITISMSRPGLTQREALKTLRVIVKARPDLVNDRINTMIKSLDSCDWAIKDHILETLLVMCQARPDLLTNTTIDEILHHFKNCSWTMSPSVQSQQFASLKAIFHERPDLVSNTNMNDIFHQLKHSELGSTRNGALNLYIDLFDANHHSLPEHIPATIEGKVLECYAKTMKLLQNNPEQRTSRRLIQ